MIRSFLVILGLFLCLSVEAATWYVRPAADCAINGNGTAYGCAASNGATGAWRTMANVTWGVGNVDTGDTLKTCSSETSPFTTADYDATNGAMLDVGAASVRVTGNCAAEGGQSRAYMDGGGVRNNGVYCLSNALCSGAVWEHIHAQNFIQRGFYPRNDLSTTATINFTGTDLSCSDIIGAAGNSPQCIGGFGAGVTLTDITSNRTTDDAVHWEGDNQTINGLYATSPGYQASTNLGDCYQCASNCDKVKLVGWTCDHRSSATKQCVIIQPNGGGGDADTLIADGECLYPETGNATYLNKAIYSGVPGGRVEHNYVLGSYYGIFVDGADTRVIGNIVVGAEFRGIDMASTVTTGTGTVAHNSISDSGDGMVFGGGASVTNNAQNNLLMNNAKGCTKGGSSTLNQSYNAWFGNTTNSNNCGALTNGVITDPKLRGGDSPSTADGFRLSATSPLRRAGLDLNQGNIQDHGNRAFLHPPSIGAWEVGSGDSITNNTRTTATTRTNRN